jgi:hypothetical protein
MNRQAKESAARAFLASVFVCVALWGSTPARAEEDTHQYPIDIEKLPLSQALEAFSRQTTLQYAYFPTDDDEERMMVGPVHGRLTVNEILSKLLPQGFTFRWVNQRTVSILPPPADTPPGGVNQAVAEKDRQHSELSKDQQLSMENGGGKSGSARGPYEFDWSMLVKGKKISDSVFDGLDLDIPAQVLRSRGYRCIGASTLSDLMRLVPQQPNLKPGFFLGDGTQFADLRGLGFDTTLVLISGRRAIPSASALAVNAFDLNSIPVSAVERVEIVSDSTSAIYGADAIGGIVNIKLRENFAEPGSISTTVLRTGVPWSVMLPLARLEATVAHEVQLCSTTSIAVRYSVANAIAGTIRISCASAAGTGVLLPRRPVTSARLRWRTYLGCQRASLQYRPSAGALR